MPTISFFSCAKQPLMGLKNAVKTEKLYEALICDHRSYLIKREEAGIADLIDLQSQAGRIDIPNQEVVIINVFDEDIGEVGLAFAEVDVQDVVGVCHVVGAATSHVEGDVFGLPVPLAPYGAVEADLAIPQAPPV